jgi:hypothetical protein
VLVVYLWRLRRRRGAAQRAEAVAA